MDSQASVHQASQDSLSAEDTARVPLVPADRLFWHHAVACRSLFWVMQSMLAWLQAPGWDVPCGVVIVLPITLLSVVAVSNE